VACYVVIFIGFQSLNAEFVLANLIVMAMAIYNGNVMAIYTLGIRFGTSGVFVQEFVLCGQC